MPLDPSIFAALGMRPKSAFDYMQEMAAVDDAKAQREFNKLRMLTAQSQYEDTQQQRSIRNRGMQAVQALGGSANDEQRISALRAAGDYGTADALEKSLLERQKTGAEVSKNTAEAEKAQLATLHSKIDRHTQALAMVNTPQDAAAWLAEGMQQGLPGFNMQSVSARVQQLQSGSPEQFQQWRQQAATAGLGLKDQIEQVWKAKEFGLKANNELIGPDGKPNQTLIGAKKDIAQAGKTVVSVNTGQHGFDNEMKLRGDFKQEPVYKAHQEVQSAYQQIKAALGQESPAGDLAGATKIMKLLDPGSVVRESELGMAMAATGLMDRITNYAQMTVNGTKLTPAQRNDFRALADKLYSASTEQFNAKRDEYKKLGEGYGLNADRAIGPAATGAKVMKFDAQGNPVQ